MWVDLGQNVPISQYEWVFLNPPITNVFGNDYGLFRFSQDWNGSFHPKGFLWLASYFPDAENFSLFKSISPRKGSTRLIDSPVPSTFVRAGLLTRQMAIKPDEKTYWYGESSWTVSVEYWEPEEATDEELLFQQLLQLETGQSQIEERLRRIEERI